MTFKTEQNLIIIRKKYRTWQVNSLGEKVEEREKLSLPIQICWLRLLRLYRGLVVGG